MNFGYVRSGMIRKKTSDRVQLGKFRDTSHIALEQKEPCVFDPTRRQNELVCGDLSGFASRMLCRAGYPTMTFCVQCCNGCVSP